MEASVHEFQHESSRIDGIGEDGMCYLIIIQDITVEDDSCSRDQCCNPGHPDTEVYILVPSKIGIT